MILQIINGVLAAISLAACAGDYLGTFEKASEDVKGYYTLCDFDNRIVEFSAANADFRISTNPKPDATNPSCVVGRAVLKGGTWDCVGCTPTFPLDFTAGVTAIRLKVLAPREGASVTLKLLPAQSGLTDPVLVSAAVKTAGKWEELTFDLSACKDKSNLLKKMYIMFDGGSKIPGTWYFDDLMVPDDDISSLSLFKRVEPHLRPDANKAWMCNSIANPEVLTPDKTLDGRWWLLVRGGDSRHSHNGYFTQEASSFNPLGPWDDNEYNPVIPAGFHGEMDSGQAIDPCGICENGCFYYYYKGISKAYGNTVLIATTKDGKKFRRVAKPWKESCGVATVFKWQDKYYLYVSRRIYVYDDILSGENAKEIEIIQKGGAPSNCDWYSINGGKISRIDGRWFLFYQAGVTNPDFPQRFHVAWSDDLMHWTKVDNPQPLFTRGPRGAWDQGAIWAPSVFEYGDTLYMYYEGWGHEGEVPDRDHQYFLPGHSEIGIATCSKADFLKWCGFNE